MTTQDSKPSASMLSPKDLLAITGRVSQALIPVRSRVCSERLADIAINTMMDELTRRGLVIMHKASADLAFKRAHPDADMGNFPISDPPAERDDADQDGTGEDDELAKVAYAADMVVLAPIRDVMHVALVQRGWEPFKDRWALPGGGVGLRETSKDAGLRKLAEEVLSVIPAWHVRTMIGIYDQPDRDPRGRVVSVAYLTVLPAAYELRSGSDAAATQWAPVRDALAPGFLAFDHAEILRDAVNIYRDALDDNHKS